MTRSASALPGRDDGGLGGPAARPPMSVVGEDPDDGEVSFGGRVDHHGTAGMVGVGGVDGDRGDGLRGKWRSWHLPEEHRGSDDERGGGTGHEARSPAGTDPPLEPGRLDSPAHTLPEAHPVREGGRRHALAQHRPEPPQGGNLVVTPGARGDVGGGSRRRPIGESVVQVRADAAPGAITRQHGCWTERRAPCILSPV